MSGLVFSTILGFDFKRHKKNQQCLLLVDFITFVALCLHKQNVDKQKN